MGTVTKQSQEKELRDDIPAVQDIGSVLHALGGTLTVSPSAEETCFMLKFPA